LTDSVYVLSGPVVASVNNGRRSGCQFRRAAADIPIASSREAFFTGTEVVADGILAGKTLVKPLIKKRADPILSLLIAPVIPSLRELGTQRRFNVEKST
jgi:hypothetical protein